MADFNADIVIVGSGMGGSHLSRSLAEAGRDVLVLEAGGKKTRGEYLSDFYANPVELKSRSWMNATTRLPSEELEQIFIAEAKEQGLIGPYVGGRTRDILLTREEWMARSPAG